MPAFVKFVNGKLYGGGRALSADLGTTDVLASGTSGAVTLIADAVITDATTALITFSSIPATYKHLRLIGAIRTNRNSGADILNIKINADATANNYNYRYVDFAGSGATAGNQQAVDNAVDSLYVAAATQTAGRFSAVTMDIPDYTSTDHHKQMTGFSTNFPDLMFIGQLWKSAVAISSIQFTPQLGTFFAQGSRLSLYGVS